MKQNDTLINNLAEGPVLSKLARFAIPIMLANLLQAVYSMVDMVVVGQFGGPAGLSAVGIGGQIQFLFLAVGMGFANGGQIVISQQVGQNSQRISKSIGTLLSLELILAIVVGAIGIVLHRPILTFMNTPAEAASQAAAYLVICSGGMIFIYGYNALCAILRGMGESRLPMVFIGIASVVNVVFDLLFVAGFSWGAAGAAAATVLAQGIAFFCALVYLYRHRDAVGFDFKLSSFAIDGQQLGALCRLGVPQVLQQFLITGSITFINSRVNLYGVTASAVDSVGGKLNSVVNIVTGAISTASSAMIAQSFGAGKLDRVSKAFRACMVICMGWFCILALCYWFLPEQIFSLFTNGDDPAEKAAVLGKAEVYMHLAIIWLLALCSMDAPFALVNGIGYASFNMIVGLIDGVVARIGLSMLLGHFMGLPGYWLGSGLAGFVTTISMGVYYLTGRWKNRVPVTH